MQASGLDLLETGSRKPEQATHSEQKLPISLSHSVLCEKERCFFLWQNRPKPNTGMRTGGRLGFGPPNTCLRPFVQNRHSVLVSLCLVLRVGHFHETSQLTINIHYLKDGRSLICSTRCFEEIFWLIRKIWTNYSGNVTRPKALWMRNLLNGFCSFPEFIKWFCSFPKDHWQYFFFPNKTVCS